MDLNYAKWDKVVAEVSGLIMRGITVVCAHAISLGERAPPSWYAQRLKLSSFQIEL